MHHWPLGLAQVLPPGREQAKGRLLLEMVLEKEPLLQETVLETDLLQEAKPEHSSRHKNIRKRLKTVHNPG